MKKLVAMLLCSVMVLSMAACGKSVETDSNTDSKTTDTKAKKIRVAMVTDTGGVNDGSFNQLSWEGLQRASKELGIEVKYLESKNEADYEPNIETLMDDEYDLILCIGYKFSNALRKAATANPDQKFAIIDDSSCSDLPNVTCLMFEQAQSSYLVGIVAGLMTKSNTVGFVIGMSTDTMNQFGYGYLAGVLDTNKKAKIKQFNANSFNDTAVGKSAAVSMITEGADVIFHAAGGVGLGVIEGCKEGKIWAIGVDSDQSKLAPKTILTSAMKRVDTACYSAAKECMEGTLKSGVVTYDLKNEGVGIAPTTDNLTEDVIKKVKEAQDKIMKGEIKVPATKQDFEAAHGKVYELD